MKKIIVVGLSDKYLQDIVKHIEKNRNAGEISKMYTSFQLFREYKAGDADIILLDSSIPDSNLIDIAKKLRQTDAQTCIVGLSIKEDKELAEEFKNSVINTEFLFKVKDNKKFFDDLLSKDSIGGQKRLNVAEGKVLEKAVGKTVLVVDDFENTLNIVKHSLEQVGFTVVPALGGREALQKLTKQIRPDIIITDLNMPNIDGFDLIEQVRTMPHLDKVPIFILTTEFSISKKIKAKELNITGWIQKPYKTKDFIQIIANTL